MTFLEFVDLHSEGFGDAAFLTLGVLLLILFCWCTDRSSRREL